MQLVAAYKDGLLACVVEYGPDSSNPNLHKQEAIRCITDDFKDVSLVFADSWEDLPETHIESFDDLVNRVVSEIEATLATKH